MRDSAIRHLAVSDESEIVAAGFFEKTVQIWSWKTGEQIGEFQTLLDFGMRKLALSPDGKRCIVGRWGPKSGGLRGLAAYSVPDGRLLWNRKQIKHIANIRMSGSGQEIYCGVQDSSAYIIDAATGEIRSRVRGAAEIVGSRYSQHRLIVPKQSKVVMECRLITSKVYSNYPNYLMLAQLNLRFIPFPLACTMRSFHPTRYAFQSRQMHCIRERRSAGFV